MVIFKWLLIFIWVIELILTFELWYWHEFGSWRLVEGSMIFRDGVHFGYRAMVLGLAWVYIFIIVCFANLYYFKRKGNLALYGRENLPPFPIVRLILILFFLTTPFLIYPITVFINFLTH